MRSSTVVALVAGSVAAQSSSNAEITGSIAMVFNPLMPAPTMTAIGSSDGTYTYVSSCTGSGIPASWLTPEPSGSVATSLASKASSASSAAGTLQLTPISAPATTAAARLRRQEEEGGLFGGFCEPLTIKQGSTSVELHMEDPSKGVWTADMNCNWVGEMTTAEITCTGTQSGSFPEARGIQGTSSEKIMGSDAVAMSLIATVSAVGPASNSASPTASGTQAGSANSTASGSGAPAATGAAAGAPLSKGVMAIVGGAAGVFAAALAL